MRDGKEVGSIDGNNVGELDGTHDGIAVDIMVGENVGLMLGGIVGSTDGISEGVIVEGRNETGVKLESADEGRKLGKEVGLLLGLKVGELAVGQNEGELVVGQTEGKLVGRTEGNIDGSVVGQ